MFAYYKTVEIAVVSLCYDRFVSVFIAVGFVVVVYGNLSNSLEWCLTAMMLKVFGDEKCVTGRASTYINQTGVHLFHLMEDCYALESTGRCVPFQGGSTLLLVGHLLTCIILSRFLSQLVFGYIL
jgi:hypothetical protein